METKSSEAAVKKNLDPIGSLFSGSWNTYKERFSTLAEIILVPAFVMILGYVLRSLGSPFATLGIIVIFAGEVLFILSSLALIISVHGNTSADESYRASLGFFWPGVWIGILSFLAIMGASIMLIIPGIWLAVAMSFFDYALVIENRRGIDALRQSREYVKGYWWPVFGRTLLLGLISMVLIIVVELFFIIGGGRGLGSSIGMAFAALITPFSVIYQYRLFENLRTLKPELAAAKTKSGRKFVLVSTIVGTVFLAAVAIGLVALVGYGIFKYIHQMPGQTIPPFSPSAQY